MNRRDFTKNIIGAGISVAIAPRIVYAEGGFVSKEVLKGTCQIGSPGAFVIPKQMLKTIKKQFNGRTYEYAYNV